MKNVHTMKSLYKLCPLNKKALGFFTVGQFIARKTKPN